MSSSQVNTMGWKLKSLYAGTSNPLGQSTIQCPWAWLAFISLYPSAFTKLSTASCFHDNSTNHNKNSYKQRIALLFWTVFNRNLVSNFGLTCLFVRVPPGRGNCSCWWAGGVGRAQEAWGVGRSERRRLDNAGVDTLTWFTNLRVSSARAPLWLTFFCWSLFSCRGQGILWITLLLASL